MPAVKAPAARGPLGAWARSARLAAGYKSAEKAVEALAARGWQMRPDYLRGIEAGSARPGPETIAALEDLYGSAAPAKPARSETPDQSDVAAAIREQTDAIKAQTDMLKGVLSTLSARLDRMTDEHRADFDMLARVLAEAFPVAAMGGRLPAVDGAPDAEPRSTNTHGQASGQ